MLEGYLNSALANGLGCWDLDSVVQSASLSVPDDVLGAAGSLLKCDIGQQWAQWFVESFYDPRGCKGAQGSYPYVFSQVWEETNKRLGQRAHDQRRAVASTIARIVQELALRNDRDSVRPRIELSRRRLLLDLSGTPPRCFYCGSQFSDAAVSRFLFHESEEFVLPQFIDILKPRGITSNDLRIEVDHVVPFASGGGSEDNLVLSCGWCNRYKSANTSLYDVSSIPISAKDSTLGFFSLPNPFWSVRLLAIRRKCEYRGGCSRTSFTDSLTIAPVSIKGALNPTNLMITCQEHDPLREIRYKPIAVIQSLWGK
jgi:hypothetical protein